MKIIFVFWSAVANEPFTQDDNPVNNCSCGVCFLDKGYIKHYVANCKDHFN